MRNIRVTALGPKAMTVEPGLSDRQIADRAIAHWDRWIERVLPERPDLIVLHEACDRPENLSSRRKAEYYRGRGLRVLEHMQTLARREGVNIAYSSEHPDNEGRLRNRTSFIGRDGSIRGWYDKNHLVWEENSEQGIAFGETAPVIRMDFGTVAGVICFDLNFDPLKEQYIQSRPELLVFSSMYHGGFVQQQWAYSCRSWFVGAVCGLPCTVINPVGEVVAQSTNYYPYVSHTINLDYAVAHLDYNWEKLDALRRKYGRGVEVRDPGLLGAVLITSETEGVSAMDMVAEFQIELLDDYMARSLKHRRDVLQMEE